MKFSGGEREIPNMYAFAGENGCIKKTSTISMKYTRGGKYDGTWFEV